MPTTRKKVIKTVYKNDDSEDEGAGDFSDSGSEAEIFEGGHSSSEDEVDSEAELEDVPSEKEDKKKPVRKQRTKKGKVVVQRSRFTTNLISKINKQSFGGDAEDAGDAAVPFSVKDLTDADKLLPPILQLSESDSSEDESPRTSSHPTPSTSFNTSQPMEEESHHDTETYKDLWSKNIENDSAEVAKKAFKELEKHKTKLEEAKASIFNYKAKQEKEKECNVNDLLALGEEALPVATSKMKPTKKKPKSRIVNDDSDSDAMDDWEEVAENKEIPQQGLQLVVDFPGAVCKKKKEVDIEMMMKRKMNRVKKEYQVFMHKVHVLCWLGHGNFVSCVLNDQEILAAALSLVPSKECYPGERVDVKYVEQITSWYKDKLRLKQDKNEDKFKPKAAPLKTQLLTQVKSKVVTSKKYMVFIFISMLRALGLQCRVMFNFVTLPIKPPTSELCSLSVKPKDKTTKSGEKDKPKSKNVEKIKSVKKESNKNTMRKKIAQVDGTYDSDDDNEFIDIMQVDGNDDNIKTRTTRSARAAKSKHADKEDEDVSPPKRARKSLSLSSSKSGSKDTTAEVPPKRIRKNNKNVAETESSTKKSNEPLISVQRRQRTKEKSTKDFISDKDDVKAAPSPTPRRRKVVAASLEERKENEKTTLSEAEQNTQNKNLTKEEGISIDSLKTKTNVSSPTTSSNRRKAHEESTEDNEIKTTSKIAKSTKSKAGENLKIKEVPRITVTEDGENLSSEYFEGNGPKNLKGRLSLNRNRSQTNNPCNASKSNEKELPTFKPRTRSAPNRTDKSKYFDKDPELNQQKSSRKLKIKDEVKEDQMRVSHRTLKAKGGAKSINVKNDLMDIIKGRVKEAKEEGKKKLVKGKSGKSSGDDSDYLPEEEPMRRPSEDDFKPTKVIPNLKLMKKIDRRVVSTDDESLAKNKMDIWCEVYVEELEQWIAVDVLKGRVHCTNQIYDQATHPVAYIVGWDNNNYLKDLTRRYVPHWNTVTRKHRAEVQWWNTAIQPWLGPKTARDREENESLDRMQLEAPLPKSISEYKNHPLYALKRHLLKFEALYPADAAVLGFVRNEPVYARECVYICKSRDIWLKEAKVVKMNEKPYKIVKKRKFDRARNVLETDHPLEIFGPWQIQDYEPPVAENGVVPRNAYGNVELFQLSMLPKGTVHIKLPGLHRVAKKCGIDCAAAITGFDFNGGWSHPVYDGYVVCEEFGEIITEAWVKDQEEQEKREIERLEIRVYGNWKRLIKGLLIRERLKLRYGFDDPPTSNDKKKPKGPKLVVKKR